MERLSLLLEKVGGLRDGLLVTVTFLYTLGYVVTAATPTNRFGPATLLDAQYLAVGVVPALLLLGGWALRGYGLRLFLGQTTQRIWWVVAILCQAAAVTVQSSVSQPAIPGKSAFVDLPNSFFLYIALSTIPVLTVLTIAPSYFASTPAERENLRAKAKLYMVALPLMIAYLMIAAYVQIMVPALPEALGGSRWRPARLDLVCKELSRSTAGLLVAPDEQRLLSTVPIIRSVPVQTFEGRNGKWLVLAVRDSTRRRWSAREILRMQNADITRQPLLELPPEAVATVLWDK